MFLIYKPGDKLILNQAGDIVKIKDQIKSNQIKYYLFTQKHYIR